MQKDQAVIEAYLGVKQERVDLCQTRDLASGACPEPENLLVDRGPDHRLRCRSKRSTASPSSFRKGEVVAVLGANGAGKTTLLHTVSGLLRARAGHVTYQGADITRLAPDKIAARGLCQVPEGQAALPRAVGAGQPGGGQFRAQGLARHAR